MIDEFFISDERFKMLTNLSFLNFTFSSNYNHFFNRNNFRCRLRVANSLRKGGWLSFILIDFILIFSWWIAGWFSSRRQSASITQRLVYVFTRREWFKVFVFVIDCMSQASSPTSIPLCLFLCFSTKRESEFKSCSPCIRYGCIVFWLKS